MERFVCMISAILCGEPASGRIDLPLLVEDARRSTVQVSGELRRARRRSTRWGGGVIVGDRHAVLTCLHVIEGYPNLIIRTHDEQEHAAHVVTVFPDRDLALLRMDSKTSYPGMKVEEGTWKPGDLAIAVGFPQQNGRSIILGKIRDIRKDVVYSSVTPDTPLLAFRADTTLGFSGGPLINVRGEFVGMVVAKTDDEDSLALPASDILATLGFKRLPIPQEAMMAEKESTPSIKPDQLADKPADEEPGSTRSRAIETSQSTPYPGE
ncbi:serine protease [bacterium]|nr:serine protease [bacterium]